MISLTVMYPKTADSQFDMRYYMDKHIPLVRELLTPIGLLQIELEEGLLGGSLDGPPTYAVIGRMFFDSVEDLGQALATHGPELIGDIQNFTNVQPQMQVCQQIGSFVSTY